MSISDKLTTIAENVQKVYHAGYDEGYQAGCGAENDENSNDTYTNGYNAGYQSGYKEGESEGYSTGYHEGYDEGLAFGLEDGMLSQYHSFWNSYQSGGERTDYRCAFAGAGWSEETFKPYYDIVPTLGYMMFSRYSKAVKDIPAYNANAKNKINGIIDLTKIDYKDSTHMFYVNDFIEHIGEIGNEDVARMHMMFNGCKSLHTIDGITTAETCDFSNAFGGCSALKNIVFHSIIDSNLDLSRSTLLTHDSLIGIINQLKDNSASGTTRILTIGTQNLAKLTSEEKEIATNKGWTLA